MFDALNEWLIRRPAGPLDIVELEGFLTAIVIGPNLLMPNIWLPKVWGGKNPRFRDLDEMNRFTALVMNFSNEIAECFAGAPDRFEGPRSKKGRWARRPASLSTSGALAS